MEATATKKKQLVIQHIKEKPSKGGGMSKGATMKAKQQYVFLAEKAEAKGDDNSSFVIAILLNSNDMERARKIARAHNARVLAMHDGDLSYRVVCGEAA